MLSAYNTIGSAIRNYMVL